MGVRVYTRALRCARTRPATGRAYPKHRWSRSLTFTPWLRLHPSGPGRPRRPARGSGGGVVRVSGPAGAPVTCGWCWLRARQYPTCGRTEAARGPDSRALPAYSAGAAPGSRPEQRKPCEGELSAAGPRARHSVSRLGDHPEARPSPALAPPWHPGAKHRSSDDGPVRRPGPPRVPECRLGLPHVRLSVQRPRRSLQGDPAPALALSCGPGARRPGPGSGDPVRRSAPPKARVAPS